MTWERVGDSWFARWTESLGAAFAEAITQFRKDDCLRHSAATSYYAILSFLPFLILTLSALGFVLAALGSGYESNEEFLGTILETTHTIIPFMTMEDLGDRVRELIEAREAFGIVGAFILILTSSLVFGALEAALNRIFDVKKGRNVVISKLLFLGFVAAVGVFMVISHYILTFVDSFVAAAGGKPLMEYVYSNPFTGIAVTYVGIAAVFGVLLRYFCPARIPLSYLAGGATLFFFLWELAKQGFSFYLQYVARFSALYGSLSTLMVFVIWIFYTVNIFLFSAVFVKVLNRDGFWKVTEPPPNALPDPGNMDTVIQRPSTVVGLPKPAPKDPAVKGS